MSVEEKENKRKEDCIRKTHSRMSQSHQKIVTKVKDRNKKSDDHSTNHLPKHREKIKSDLSFQESKSDSSNNGSGRFFSCAISQ